MHLHPDTASWIMDHLSGRPQYVRVDGYASVCVRYTVHCIMYYIISQRHHAHSSWWGTCPNRFLISGSFILFIYLFFNFITIIYYNMQS